jgi:HTH-type transcriptional regulator/antitoxin HigA
MEIRPIRSEKEYEARLEEIEAFFEHEPEPGTSEADHFDLLAMVISDYEDRRWPIDPPHPIAAIRFAMEQRGYTQAELAKLLGSRSRASEILSKKRHLTVEMAWKLHRHWKIPAEALLRPYALVRTRSASAKDTARRPGRTRRAPSRTAGRKPRSLA